MSSRWLLDLEIGGGLRFAEQRLEVPTEDGRTLLYEEGLGEVDASGADGELDQEVRVELVCGEDWAGLEAAGHVLDRARGTLRRWWDGTTLEEAEVVLVGYLDAPTYGAQWEPMECSLVRSGSGETETAPRATEVVSTTTWPITGGWSLETQSEGSWYPIVIGCPGADPAGPRPAVPAPCAQTDGADGRVLLGRDIAATSATVVNVDTGATETVTPDLVDDLAGQPVWTAVVTGGGAFGASTDRYYASYDPATGGGADPRVNGATLRGAGDVLAWVLGQSTLRADISAMRAHSQWLNQFKCDTWINCPTNLWDWASSTILRWLPVAVRQSAAGLYFVPVRWDYRASDVVCWLSADRHEVDRAGPIGRIRQDLYSEVTVLYRPTPDGGWYSSRTLAAEQGRAMGAPLGVTDSRVIGTHLARRALVKRALTVEVAQTYDDATAVLVAMLLLERHAWPKRTVQYVGGSELVERIPIGSAIGITDAEVHLEETVCYVADVQPEGALARLDLVVLDHPVCSRGAGPLELGGT